MKLTINRYIDPLTDWGFKRLFGSERNKDFLKDFLNDLFEGEKHIADIEYLPNNHTADPLDSNQTILDLTCTDHTGEQFIVELQCGKKHCFRERSLYNTSRLIHEKFSVGKESNSYELKDVYLIAILDFNLEQVFFKKYLHDICLMDKETGEVFSNKLRYKFLELPNFIKRPDELETGLDRWFYLLKHMSHLERRPPFFNKRIFEKVFQVSKISTLTKVEQIAYSESLKQKQEYENVFSNAGQEAEKRKYTEGKQEGIQATKIETARKLKGKGYSFTDISELTDLSILEVEKLLC
ncbi:hypothetical protein ADIARSV_1226 [Arcticibacter svalbardensis MN12-7]|uniref:Transposase n=1 Tax=Arcticibacter svalbardensis MN12-7 TaxID=1150600 RepID=R9GVT2_9SPHI|nr:Rpn family recombination-promoting nuclease/putative transposase [Arcticibacter svalbardensis]EOR95620.1 hypothetical protein ADIARSV_1226 [Arcticibacter svalbardensis MN12-7]